MGKMCQLVMGPAGSGKSTYCSTLMTHCQNTGRSVHLVNMDPAAENFTYNPSIDIRDLITLDDVVEELQYGPNGGLIYCMEYLVNNIDWFEEQIENFEDDYLIMDCPGQIELYTHFPVMRKIVDTMTRLGYRVCGVYLLDSQFIEDAAKFFSGVMSAMSAMVQLEIPHVNVLTKMDLVSRKVRDSAEMDRYFDPDPTLLMEDVNRSTHPKLHALNKSIVQLIEEFNMVSFIPLNIHDEDSVTLVLAHVDNAIQYGEDVEPKEPKALTKTMVHLQLPTLQFRSIIIINNASILKRVNNVKGLSYYSTSSSSSAYPKPHLIPNEGTYPKGFSAGGVAAGVKKKAGVLDMTMVFSKTPCTAAGVFTKNAFAAAPVQVDKKILETWGSGGIHGVLVNSGCANACTGDQGLADAWETSKLVDASMKIPPESIPKTIVMSTGVIGQHLKMDKIKNGVSLLTSPNTLSSTHSSWMKSAEGIMTTDTFPKLRSKKFNNNYTMAGWCKGAGMIHPNMATMLGAIFTDVKISQECLQDALKYAADRSFNAVSVDGDTSTNDTLVVLANGEADSGVEIKEVGSKEFLEFRQNLTDFAVELAELIVRDGEGATKFIEIEVGGAKTFEEAKHIASTIATSPLVKTAIYGRDANWGRIICAVGYSGIENLDPSKVNMHFGTRDNSKVLHLFKDGAPFQIDEEVAEKILECEDVKIKVGLGRGDAVAKMYTCDFSHEYISINADYRT
ncbi:hypothetical protein HDU76_011246 [Blyttiomyces sp. JEL0837]|nr:hypothetical protein HDU76_011246 [Blyttiomyces sp. JEL0837]